MIFIIEVKLCSLHFNLNNNLQPIVIPNIFG
jgi:hypothetical protein